MFVAASATHVRPRLARDLSRFGKITFFVWALIGTGVYPRPPYEMALGYATAAAAILGIVAIMASARLTTAKTRPARATIEGRKLVIERAGKRFELDTLRDVSSVCGVSNATEITTRAGDVWGFVHASPAEADAFAEALGFGSGGRRATYDVALPTPIRSRVGLAVVAAFAGAIVSLVIAMVLGSYDIKATNVMALSLMAIFYELMRFRARRPVVTVGVDGVEIAHRWRTRFIPATAIARVASDASGTLIQEHDGTRTEIDGPNVFRQTALAARVRSIAMGRYTQPPAALARRGRSIREWREHLREAVGGRYRVASDPIEAFEAQLSSSAATPEQRVGAALALRVADDEGGAVRVRIAAEQCADPRLREALEAAAAQEIDDAQLERALSRLAKSRSVE